MMVDLKYKDMYVLAGDDFLNRKSSGTISCRAGLKLYALGHMFLTAPKSL